MREVFDFNGNGRSDSFDTFMEMKIVNGEEDFEDDDELKDDEEYLDDEEEDFAGDFEGDE